MNQNRISTKSDKAGIASAVLCMIHCLVIPVLFLLKFSFTDNTILQLPLWWEKIDYIFLAISFIAVYHSAGHTRFKEIKIGLWLFWGILATAIVFSATLHWMAYIASAGLIVTHFVNIMRIRKFGSYV